MLKVAAEQPTSMLCSVSVQAVVGAGSVAEAGLRLFRGAGKKSVSRGCPGLCAEQSVTHWQFFLQ